MADKYAPEAWGETKRRLDDQALKDARRKAQKYWLEIGRN